MGLTPRRSAKGHGKIIVSNIIWIIVIGFIVGAFPRARSEQLEWLHTDDRARDRQRVRRYLRPTAFQPRAAPDPGAPPRRRL
jgi:hypothetical protein